MTAGLSFAIRRAGRQKGLSVALIAALALGLGGATAILALANRVLVNPIGLPQPQRVVHIYAGRDPATVAAYAPLPAFAAVAGYGTGALTLAAGGLRGREYVAAVTRGFFGVAGTVPRAGRQFSAGELDSGDRVAIISSGLAGGGFHGAAVGRALSLGGVRFTIIGVMPAGFEFPAGTSVWIPYNAGQKYLALQNGAVYGGLIGRLRRGVSLQQASAQVEAEMQRQIAALEAAHPGQKFGISSVFAVSVVKNWAQRSRTTVDLLLAAAGVLWLVACFAVGGVLVARSLADQKEMATRLALGARRRRLAAQWIWEVLVLIVPAALAAAGVAAALMAALRRGAPAGMLGLDLLHPRGEDWGALAGLSLVALIVTAVPPALSTLRLRPPAEMLQSAFYGKVRASVLWPVLVVAELTLALVLTASATLLLASYGKLTRVNLGFNPAGVSTVTYTALPAMLPLLRKARAAGGAGREALLQAAVARGVRVEQSARRAADKAARGPVAASSNPPLLSESAGLFMWATPGPPGRSAEAVFSNISGDYFSLLGIPLLRGRSFTVSAAQGAPPVIIVSRAVAQALWGSANPIGRRMRVGNETRPRTVIGEAADVLPDGPGQEPFGTGQIYMPSQQPYNHQPSQQMTLLARAPAGLIAARLAPVSGVEVLDSTTLTAAAAKALAPQRFSALVLAMFSGLALLLVALGVLGLLAHWVDARRHEIAVRLALGASPQAMARTVLARMALLLAAAAGLALMLSPMEKALLGSVLYGISPLDLGLWATAVACVCFVSLAAGAIPALRAARIATAEILRHE
ncbi:MAG: ABC transporter permease [Terriglobales bacterium]